MLKGKLPTQRELADFHQELRQRRKIKYRLKDVINAFPESGHPMDALQSSVAALGMFYPFRNVATDAAGAAEAWQRAVAIEPRDYDSLFNLGIVLSVRPEPQDALPYLKRFVAEAPRDRYLRDIARSAALISRIERR